MPEAIVTVFTNPDRFSSTEKFRKDVVVGHWTDRNIGVRAFVWTKAHIGLNHVHVVLPSGTLGRFASRIAIGPFYSQILVLLISTVFASAYFLVFRFIVAERAQNHIAGLAGFFLIAAAALTWLDGTHAVRSQSLPRHAQIVAPLVAILSFVVGTVLTSANLAWALLKK